MSDNKEPEQSNITDTQIARLTVLADTRYFDAVTDMVADIAKAQGLSEEAAHNLDEVLLEVLQKVLEYGYEGDTTQSVDITLSKRSHSFVVAVEDKGLPFDYQRLEHGEDPRFSSFLSLGFADRVHFVNLGPSGNRVELVRDLPATDIRNQLDPEEHQATIKAEEAHPDESLSIRMVQPDEAVELARLVYRCYGYTYPNEFMYYPEQVEARLKSGLMKSCGAYNSRNDMVGHLALSFDRAGAMVAESGIAVVDPRYRGHKLFERMKQYLREYAAQNQVAGFYSEAVTVHPYSQKGSIALGGHEVGFLLAYSPGTVFFHGISNQEKPRRQSVALMYTPVLDSAPASVYLPEVYHPIVKNIYDACGMKREISMQSDTRGNRLSPKGRLNVSLRPDHNQAFLVVETPGENTLGEIRFHLKQLILHHIDCIYVDLPIWQVESGSLANGLRNLGFFFGGIIPELRGGDVLRLQYLNNVEVAPEDIAVASDFGRELLDMILQDRLEVTG
jgi:anti-sigma regulatory factor (Ser/Thr protein kinase)